MLYFHNKFPTLDKVIDDLNRLKYAYELFEKLWCELDVYDKPKSVSDETWNELLKFWDFDDSE